MKRSIQRRTLLKPLPMAPALISGWPGFAASGLRLSPTTRGTHAIAWPGGSLELNLVPMSTAVRETSGVTVGYTRMREAESLYLPVADLRGITALQLDGSPKVPRILWDNRERDKHTISHQTYRQPVLVSRKEDCFGGLRHVTMSEPAPCAGIVTWNSQARDYTIQPPGGNLKSGESFRARIRHVIAPAETERDLELLWREFETGVLRV